MKNIFFIICKLWFYILEKKKNFGATSLTFIWILGGEKSHTIEFSFRHTPGCAFKEAVVTSDEANIVILVADKGHREALCAYNIETGELASRVPLRYSGVKVGNFKLQNIFALKKYNWSNLINFVEFQFSFEKTNWNSGKKLR